MDPLRQPQAQKIICETRPTSQINGKAKKTGETINGERYRTQLIYFKRAIAEKRPEYATRHEAIIFHHDNARPHVAIPVKNYLKNSGWEILPHPHYSPDLAPSYYHLFRSM